MYQDILGGTPAEDLADRRRLTQAQALFDIAQAGFAFAQPGSRRQSPVSRLGEALTETQLFPKIGARAAELQGYEEEQARQARATDLAALQGALGQAQTEQQLLSDKALAELRAQKDAPNPKTQIIVDLATGNEQYIDANSPTGQAAIAAVSERNRSAGRKLFELRDVPSLSSRSAKAFRLPSGNLALSYDGGRTYTAPDGTPSQIPQGSIPLSDTIANDVRRVEEINAEAAEQLYGMGSPLILGLKGGTRENPQPLSQEDRETVSNSLKARRATLEGTGPYANFAAAADATLGSFVPGLDEIWTDTQENRQFLKGLRVLGRAALVVNPRFPVAEMENVAELFPDEKTVFTNPKSELKKLQNLRALAEQQRRFNLEQLVRETDGGVISQIRANNFEIERLLDLLGPMAPRDEGRGLQLRGSFIRQSQQGR